MPSLDEVLVSFPDRRLLIDIKSNDPADGEKLAHRLAQLPATQLSRIAVYGGDRPRGGAADAPWPQDDVACERAALLAHLHRPGMDRPCADGVPAWAPARSGQRRTLAMGLARAIPGPLGCRRNVGHRRRPVGRGGPFAWRRR